MNIHYFITRKKKLALKYQEPGFKITMYKSSYISESVLAIFSIWLIYLIIALLFHLYKYSLPKYLHQYPKEYAHEVCCSYIESRKQNLKTVQMSKYKGSDNWIVNLGYKRLLRNWRKERNLYTLTEKDC